MSLTYLIIDDEPLARKRLYALLKIIPEFEFLDKCGTGKKAIKLIDTLHPDVIFLDIQMKDITGFDVLKAISPEKRPLTIFVTAYDQYAIQAFEFLAFDYLLKPFRKDRFLQCIDNILKHFDEKESYHLKNNKIEELLNYLESSVKKEKTSIDRLPLKNGNTTFFITLNAIKYILASGSYVEIFTNEKALIHRSSLTNLLYEIEDHSFIRIHRSTAINVNYLDKIIHSDYGEIDVKMTDGKLLRVSKSYKKGFQNAIGIK